MTLFGRCGRRYPLLLYPLGVVRHSVQRHGFGLRRLILIAIGFVSRSRQGVLLSQMSLISDLDELYCCGRRAAAVTVDHDELGPARYI